MGSFWLELKRRRVIRVAVVYAIVAWGLIQMADVGAPALLLPSWVASLVTFLLILGFPAALVLAWAYDLTPSGIKPAPDANESAESSTSSEANREDNDETSIGLTSQTDSQSAEPSIAVLPFTNISPDPHNEYFSDGISEELLNVLTRIGGWRVAARTSCFHFKGREEKIQTIGQELKVNTVLEGSVRTVKDRVRVTAQLVNVADGYHLWSGTYDHQLDDLLQVQDEIAQAIVGALKGKILEGDESGLLPTRNEDAYQNYLRGRFLWQRRDAESISEGIDQLREAIGIDPDFADAYASLAAAYHKVPLYDPSADAAVMQRLAEAAAREALRLNPDIVEASATLGSILADSHRYEAADETFARALDIADNNATTRHWYAIFLMNTGRLSKALEHIRIALRLDPLNGAIIGTHGNVSFALGRIESAIESYESAMELGWGDAAHAFLGAVYLYLGNRKKAGPCLRAGRFAAEAVPSRLVDAILNETTSDTGGSATLGDQILASVLADDITPALGFRLCALLGQVQIFDLPFDVQDVSGDALGTLWHPPAATIRRDRRFKSLAERFDLPVAWQQSSDWPDRCHPTDDGFVCD
jgi:TolB-like protein/Tfp pilus assembly protein PilF